MDSQLPKVVIANNTIKSVSLVRGRIFLFNDQHRREGMKKLLGVFLASCMVCTLVGQAGAQELSGQQWQAKRHAMQQERQALRQKMEGYRQQMEALNQQMQQEMQRVNQLREQMRSLREQMCQVRDTMHSLQHVDHQRMQPVGGQGMQPGGDRAMGLNGKPMAL